MWDYNNEPLSCNFNEAAERYLNNRKKIKPNCICEPRFVGFDFHFGYFREVDFFIPKEGCPECGPGPNLYTEELHSEAKYNCSLYMMKRKFGIIPPP